MDFNIKKDDGDYILTEYFSDTKLYLKYDDLIELKSCIDEALSCMACKTNIQVEALISFGNFACPKCMRRLK